MRKVAAVAVLVTCALALGPAAQADVQVIVGGPDPTATPHASAKSHAHAAKTTPAPRQATVLEGQSARGAMVSQRIVDYALRFLGTPYVWGGSSPAGFDCSGYTWYAFRMLGIAIPRTADLQFAAGRPVAMPLPGDLVFFQTYDYGASHVGIYIGAGRFVSSISGNVHISSFAQSYFAGRYIGARRFFAVD